MRMPTQSMCQNHLVYTRKIQNTKKEEEEDDGDDDGDNGDDDDDETRLRQRQRQAFRFRTAVRKMLWVVQQHITHK